MINSCTRCRRTFNCFQWCFEKSWYTHRICIFCLCFCIQFGYKVTVTTKNPLSGAVVRNRLDMSITFSENIRHQFFMEVQTLNTQFWTSWKSCSFANISDQCASRYLPWFSIWLMLSIVFTEPVDLLKAATWFQLFIIAGSILNISNAFNFIIHFL